MVCQWELIFQVLFKKYSPLACRIAISESDFWWRHTWPNSCPAWQLLYYSMQIYFCCFLLLWFQANNSSWHSNTKRTSSAAWNSLCSSGHLHPRGKFTLSCLFLHYTATFHWFTLLWVKFFILPKAVLQAVNVAWQGHKHKCVDKDITN